MTVQGGGGGGTQWREGANTGELGLRRWGAGSWRQLEMGAPTGV